MIKLLVLMFLMACATCYADDVFVVLSTGKVVVMPRNTANSLFLSSKDDPTQIDLFESLVQALGTPLPEPIPGGNGTNPTK